MAPSRGSREDEMPPASTACEEAAEAVAVERVSAGMRRRRRRAWLLDILKQRVQAETEAALNSAVPGEVEPVTVLPPRRRRRPNNGDVQAQAEQLGENFCVSVRSLAGNEQFRFEVPHGTTAGYIARRIAEIRGTWEGFVRLVLEGRVLQASNRLPARRPDEHELMVTLVLRGTVSNTERNRFMNALHHSGRPASEILEEAPARVRNDLEIVKEAVRLDKQALARTHLSANKEVALEAVRADATALMQIAEALRGDRDVVMEAVKKEPMLLRCASAAIRADRDIVCEAVQGDGRALQFAADHLRADREVVLDAVWQNPWALRFAARELQADPTLHDEVKGTHPDNGPLVVSQVLRELQADGCKTHENDQENRAA